MKKILLVFLFFMNLYSFSQNSSSAYATSRPINIDLSELLYKNTQKSISSSNSFFSNLDNSSVALLIYGGENYSVFLGCINCNDNDSKSIWNKYGGYGSIHDKNSIWNSYSNFSGIHSDYSPFNLYAKKPPILLDKNGNFYGFFTINKNFNDRTKYNLASYICENWKEIKDDIDKFYNYIFE